MIKVKIESFCTLSVHMIKKNKIIIEAHVKRVQGHFFFFIQQTDFVCFTLKHTQKIKVYIILLSVFVSHVYFSKG